MKLFGFLAALVLSTSAWANECPDIEGQYNDGRGYLDFNITDWNINDAQLLLISFEDEMAMPFVMDGAERVVNDYLKVTGQCSSGHASLSLALYKVDSENNNHFRLDRVVAFDFLNLPTGDIVLTHTDTQKDSDDDEYTEIDRLYCTKVQEKVYNCEKF